MFIASKTAGVVNEERKVLEQTHSSSINRTVICLIRFSLAIIISSEEKRIGRAVELLVVSHLKTWDGVSGAERDVDRQNPLKLIHVLLHVSFCLCGRQPYNLSLCEARPMTLCFDRNFRRYIPHLSVMPTDNLLAIENGIFPECIIKLLNG